MDAKCPGHKIFCTVVYGITFNIICLIYRTSRIKRVAQGLEDECRSQYSFKCHAVPQKSLEHHIYGLKTEIQEKVEVICTEAEIWMNVM